MSKIKTLLQLVENVEDGRHNDYTYQTDEMRQAIREAKLEHDQLIACIKELHPRSFRDIQVYEKLKALQ